MDDAFEARRARVEAAAASRRSAPVDAAPMRREEAGRPTPQAGAEEGAGGWAIISLPLAFLAGALSVLAARLLMFHVIAPNPEWWGLLEETMQPHLAVWAIAFALAFAADRLLRGGMAGQTMTTMGFLLMMWFEEELAYRLPGLWAMFYDAPYAATLASYAPSL